MFGIHCRKGSVTQPGPSRDQNPPGWDIGIAWQPSFARLFISKGLICLGRRVFRRAMVKMVPWCHALIWKIEIQQNPTIGLFFHKSWWMMMNDDEWWSSCHYCRSSSRTPYRGPSIYGKLWDWDHLSRDAAGILDAAGHFDHLRGCDPNHFGCRWLKRRQTLGCGAVETWWGSAWWWLEPWIFFKMTFHILGTCLFHLTKSYFQRGRLNDQPVIETMARQ